MTDEEKAKKEYWDNMVKQYKEHLSRPLTEQGHDDWFQKCRYMLTTDFYRMQMRTISELVQEKLELLKKGEIK